MPPRSEILQTRVPPDVRDRLEAAAEEAGVTVSALLWLVIETVVDGQDAPEGPRRFPSRSRREGKVTVRLAEDVRGALGKEARSRGIAVSTWAASMIRARYRGSPQPLPKDRPQAPLRTHARAMPTARCDFPVPVPPSRDIASQCPAGQWMSTTFR